MTENTQEPTKSDHFLAAKITSLDQLESLLDSNPHKLDHGVSNALASLSTPPEGVSDSENFYLGSDNVEYWWLKRERLRELNGVYEAPTDVLRHIREAYGCLPLFPHISTKVPGEIAYTPSRRDGREDRQVRTTLGKFLSKYCPLLTDKAIANIDAAHKAELDDTFLVARTPDEIEAVYTRMLGDTGCMRYTKSHFGQKFHPSAVYSYEGLGVAYLTNSDGAINARAVIYDNPSDPTDKRYVRIYGNRLLGRKLERAGYKCDGLGGVKLKRIPGKVENTVILPYMDPAGGIHSAIRADHNAGQIVVFKGDDFVTAVTDTEVNRLKKFGIVCSGARSQTGAVAVIENARGLLVCALSGEPIDIVTHDPVYVVRSLGGPIELALGQHLPDNFRACSGVFGRNHVSVWAAEEHVIQGYAASADTFKHYGFMVPHSKYQGLYSDLIAGVEWVKLDGDYPLPTAVRREDAIKYFDEAGDARVMLVSEKPSGSVSVMHDANSLKTWAHPKSPKLIKTVGGKYAIPGYSPVLPYAPGGFCSARVGVAGTMFGIAYRRAEGSDASDPSTFSDQFVQVIADRIIENAEPYADRGTDDWAQRITRTLRSLTLGYAAPYRTSSGALKGYDGYYDAMNPGDVVVTHHIIKKHIEAGAKLSTDPGRHASWTMWYRVVSCLIEELKTACRFTGNYGSSYLEHYIVSIPASLLPPDPSTAVPPTGDAAFPLAV